MRSTTTTVARKSSIGGLYVYMQGGFDILKFDKLNWFVVFNTSNWGRGGLFGEGLVHQSPQWRRDWVPPDHLGSEISFLRTCNVPKHCENIKTKTTYLNYVCTLFVFW